MKKKTILTFCVFLGICLIGVAITEYNNAAQTISLYYKIYLSIGMGGILTFHRIAMDSDDSYGVFFIFLGFFAWAALGLPFEEGF